MTNPTLERAARAVSEVMASAPAKAMNDAEWIDFERKIARAVLMAVREPDEAMVKAGTPHMPVEAEFHVKPVGGEFSRRYHHSVRVKRPHECVSPAGPYTAMIDAILNDGEEE